jgi:hypothetical protein
MNGILTESKDLIDKSEGKIWPETEGGCPEVLL